MENLDTEETSYQQPPVLPKPILEQDKKNWIRRSLVSLGIYAFLFYVIFDQTLIYIAALLLVVMIHESGHFIAMKFFKYNDVKLFIIPLLSAYVSGKKSTISQRQRIIIILAGPVPGIIIGSCLLISTVYYPSERIEMLGNIFFFLNWFNLLPIIPLDGGRLLETLFIHQNHVIRLVFTIISIICLSVLAILFKNPILLIIPLSMVFDLLMEIKNHKIREYLKQENINYITDYKDLPDRDYWSIRDCILLSFGKRYTGVQAGVQQYSLLEGGLIQHVISVLKIPFIKDVKIFGKIIVTLIYIFFLIILPFYIFS
ncbi:MAG: site-2 protease family protein [Bacteroidota bacterium]